MSQYVVYDAAPVSVYGPLGSAGFPARSDLHEFEDPSVLAQAIATSATFEDATVPEPPVTWHVTLAGVESTLTA
jgi:hypothetical protein